MTMFTQTPGSFASLQDWLTWREHLRTVGADEPAVDAELTVTELVIAELTAAFDPAVAV